MVLAVLAAERSRRAFKVEARVLVGPAGRRGGLRVLIFDRVGGGMVRYGLRVR